MKAIVVSGGEAKDRRFYKQLIERFEVIIGVDGGCEHLRGWGVLPDVAVGDFDSITTSTLSWLEENRVRLKRFPAQKDSTDTELALEEAVALGAGEVALTATWGGRPDQTLANLFLLRRARELGVNCHIVEETGEIILVDCEIKLAGRPGDIVSLMALEDCRGLQLRGFKYHALGGLLATGVTVGISNVLVATEGEICLDSGLLLVVHLYQ